MGSRLSTVTPRSACGDYRADQLGSVEVIEQVRSSRYLHLAHGLHPSTHTHTHMKTQTNGKRLDVFQHHIGFLAQGDLRLYSSVNRSATPLLAM